MSCFWDNLDCKGLNEQYMKQIIELEHWEIERIPLIYKIFLNHSNFWLQIWIIQSLLIFLFLSSNKQKEI